MTQRDAGPAARRDGRSGDATPTPLSFRAAWRSARPIDVPSDRARGLLLDGEVDRRFAHAFDQGLDALPTHQRRGALAGVTGHVAESLVESLAVEEGWQPFWHQTGVGRAGVDILALLPDADGVAAIEVKATLRAGAIPRLGRRQVLQMSDEWLNAASNAGMDTWELCGPDVHRLAATVDFARRELRLVAITARGYLPASTWDHACLLFKEQAV